MTNFVNGKKLLDEAKEISEEVAHAYERKSWNMVVRRSQEVVELSIKALLKAMGIDYPKEHDVGKILEEVLKKRGPKTSGEELRLVGEVSTELAQERAPAFYYERDYTQQEAERARGKAAKVLKFALNMAEKLRKSERN